MNQRLIVSSALASVLALGPSPFLTWPARTAWSSARGIEAAEVLPCWSTVTTILSVGMPSFLAVWVMMRMLA